MCISWPYNNYAFLMSFFVTFKLRDFSVPKWRKIRGPSIFISRDNPELPHTRYSFIYCVKFSHCRHSNLNWLLVAIHQGKACNLETLLPEMLTGIGPYVCWRFLRNSDKHYVVVASVEGCTYCHVPVYVADISEVCLVSVEPYVESFSGVYLWTSRRFIQLLQPKILSKTLCLHVLSTKVIRS